VLNNLNTFPKFPLVLGKRTSGKLANQNWKRIDSDPDCCGERARTAVGQTRDFKSDGLIHNPAVEDLFYPYRGRTLAFNDLSLRHRPKVREAVGNGPGDSCPNLPQLKRIEYSRGSNYFDLWARPVCLGLPEAGSNEKCDQVQNRKRLHAIKDTLLEEKKTPSGTWTGSFS